MSDQFYFEDPSDSENQITVSASKAGGVYVAVSEERAVDSYNHTFECTIALDKEHAEKLRDYLLLRFPISSPHER